MYFLVEQNRQKFIETGNALYAWKAIEHARGFGVAIPDEIQDYLWQVAHKLVQIPNNGIKPAQRPVAVAKALKLHKDGAGQGSAFDEFSKKHKSRKMALDTAKRIEEWGEGKADYAFENIAEKYHCSKATIRRNYIAHLEQWGLMAKKFLEDDLVTYDKDGLPMMQVGGTADDVRESCEILKAIENTQTPA